MDETPFKVVDSDLVRSYSKKAFPWDNACIESFHALIKREWLNHFDIASIKEAYRFAGMVEQTHD